jgi:hypothetical protein
VIITITKKLKNPQKYTKTQKKKTLKKITIKPEKHSQKMEFKSAKSFYKTFLKQ